MLTSRSNAYMYLLEEKYRKIIILCGVAEIFNTLEWI